MSRHTARPAPVASDAPAVEPLDLSPDLDYMGEPRVYHDDADSVRDRWIDWTGGIVLVAAAVLVVAYAIAAVS